MKLRFSEQALDDLADIRAYLMLRSPEGAESVRLDILSVAELLAQFPEIGRATDIAGVRVIPTPHYPYLIYHAVSGKEVVIIHIMHARREFLAIDE